jgi:hypothetical protein
LIDATIDNKSSVHHLSLHRYPHYRYLYHSHYITIKCKRIQQSSIDTLTANHLSATLIVHSQSSVSLSTILMDSNVIAMVLPMVQSAAYVMTTMEQHRQR